jgi:DNA-binding GntR family transcriptional regulator
VSGQERATAGRANLKWPAVYKAVLGRIRAGALEPGAPVYVRALALEFGVGAVTAQRAVAWLARDGFLEWRDRVGYVVARGAGGG